MTTDLQLDVSNTVSSRYWGRNGSQANPCVLIAGVIFSIKRANCQRHCRWCWRQGKRRLGGRGQWPFLDPATFTGAHPTSRRLPVRHGERGQRPAGQGVLRGQAGAALSLQEESAFLKGALDQRQEPFRRRSISNSGKRWQEVR